MGFDGWMLFRLAIPSIAVVIDQKSRYDSRSSQEAPVSQVRIVPAT